jgi:ParB-like chromosome segregation protein Spo0J
MNGNKILEKEIRPMKKEWVDIIKNKCFEENVPFFFKQWGKTKNNPNQDDHTINTKHRYHSKGGCELDGKVYWSNPTMSNNSAPTINLLGNDYLIMDEVENLVTIWELKTHLPLAEKDLFENLKEDIKKNGLNAPIIYIQAPNGKKLVIEGHTRLNALLELKCKDIPTKLLNETFNSIDEIKLWIVKHQLGRRNLTTEERVRLAFLSKPTIEKLAKENLSKAGKTTSKAIDEETNSAKIMKVDTFAEIAKIANVGRTTVVNYNKIMNEANKSTKEQLSKGLITIGAAHSSLKNKIELGSQKPEKKQNAQKEKLDKPSNIIVLENIDDGTQKISNGEIDVVMIFNKTDKLDILKKNSNVRIGVYYLE